MTAHIVEIVVRGGLSSELIAALDGFRVRSDPPGMTCITGAVPDQSMLIGILDMFDGLNIEVVSVNRVGEASPAQDDAPPQPAS
ncbi:hypothetical protein AB4Z18_14275 [Leifsonia sp. 2TAF2]|uniref:hypothetical protein n=1 Tax=Leifsonia sp. 2TAF2 TaxID=3233009 RepID=UPI003F9C0066